MAYPQYEKITKKNLVDYLYPVDSIYINISSTDPSTFFENTTWERLPDGLVRTLIPESYSVGSSNGITTHNHSISSTSLTIQNIPLHNHPAVLQESGSHTHNQRGNVGVQWGETTYVLSIGSGAYANIVDFGMNSSGSHSHTISIYEEGGGTSHTHTSTSATSLPPYIKVNVWKRTA